METDDIAEAPRVDDNGVVRLVLPARQRTAADVQKFVDATRQLLDRGRAPLLLDARLVPAVKPEAWMAAIKNVESIATAVAIVISTTTPSFIGVYQDRINAMLVPCRLFVDIDAAEHWVTTVWADGEASS